MQVALYTTMGTDSFKLGKVLKTEETTVTIKGLSGKTVTKDLSKVYLIDMTEEDYKEKVLESLDI